METISTTSSGNIVSINDLIERVEVSYGSNYISGGISKRGKGINPLIYFKYVKKKLSMMEKMRIDNRLKKLKKAFYSAVDNGQEYLSEKILNKIEVETRQTLMFAKGIKLFIEKEDLDKYKHKVRGGHISDTKFEKYTRAIPEKILKKKAKVEDCFDDFVIYHYYNKQAVKEMEKKGEKMDPQEKANMKDPILFGRIKQSSRLYFIGDWDDEYCDLTFDELVDELGKDESDITIKRNPTL